MGTKVNAPIGGGAGGKFEVSNGILTKGIIDSKLSKPAYVTQAPKTASITTDTKSMGSVSLGGYEPAVGYMEDDGAVVVAHGTSYSTGRISVSFPDGTAIATSDSVSKVYMVSTVFQVSKGKFCIVGYDISNYLEYSIFTYSKTGITFVSNGKISTNYIDYIRYVNIVHRRNGKYRLYCPNGSKLNYMEFRVSNNTLSVTTGSITLDISLSTSRIQWSVQHFWDSNKLFVVGHYSYKSNYDNYYYVVNLDTGKVEQIARSSEIWDIYRKNCAIAFNGTYYYYITGLSGDYGGYEYTLHKMEKVGDTWTEVATISLGSPSSYYNAVALCINNGLVFIWLTNELVIINPATNIIMQRVSANSVTSEIPYAFACGCLAVRYGFYGTYSASTQTLTVNDKNMFFVELRRSNVEMIMPANEGNVLVDCYA